jgi:hypothetical protein
MVASGFQSLFSRGLVGTMDEMQMNTRCHRTIVALSGTSIVVRHRVAIATAMLAGRE